MFGTLSNHLPAKEFTDLPTGSLNVFCLQKTGNNHNPACPGAQHLTQVFCLNASDTEHRYLCSNSSLNLFEIAETNSRAPFLGRCGKERAKPDVGGSLP